MSDNPSSWPVPLDDGRPAGQQIRDMLDESRLHKLRGELYAHMHTHNEHREFSDEQYKAQIAIIEWWLFAARAKRVVVWVLATVAAGFGLAHAVKTFWDSMPWGK